MWPEKCSLAKTRMVTFDPCVWTSRENTYTEREQKNEPNTQWDTEMSNMESRGEGEGEGEDRGRERMNDLLLIDFLLLFGALGNPGFTSHLRFLRHPCIFTNSHLPKPTSHISVTCNQWLPSKCGITTCYVTPPRMFPDMSLDLNTSFVLPISHLHVYDKFQSLF